MDAPTFEPRAQPAALMALRQETPNLDVMRSLAVMFVVTFHVSLFFRVLPPASPFYNLGHWGVIMFFVHTSFVLIASLERQRERRPEQSLFVPFFTRRIFRIAPLATLIVLAIVILRLPVAHLRDGHFQGISITPSGVIANLLFVQNLTETDSLEAPMWSLPYEMQMYLVLPILYLLVRRISTRIALLGWWLTASMICLLCVRFGDQSPNGSLAYLPCFLAGVGAYGLLRLPHNQRRFVFWPVTLIACTLLYLWHPTLPMSWVCCLALAVAISRCAAMRRGTVSRACNLIARYSYGIYLTHFICIWLAFSSLASLSWPLKICVFLVTTIALPIGLYHFVEAPMIDWGSRLTGNPRFRENKTGR
jgi:peptidoglycan/LPS O-acetylase OafA/YrhL